jgi:hypothetical protein
MTLESSLAWETNNDVEQRSMISHLSAFTPDIAEKYYSFVSELMILEKNKQTQLKKTN